VVDVGAGEKGVRVPAGDNLGLGLRDLLALVQDRTVAAGRRLQEVADGESVYMLTNRPEANA
jgi:hypothetical protein